MLWALVHAPDAGYSWHYFSLGGRLLTSGAGSGTGVHLYASHPELQIGPLTLLVAAPLRSLDPWSGQVAAVVLLSGLGVALLACLAHGRQAAAGQRTQSNPLLLVTGLLVIPVWSEVATHYAHLDDALALAFAVLALLSFQAGKPVLTALMLAAAADCKPWAVGFGVLLMALPACQRRGAALVFAGSVALAWLPFVLGDSGTLSALGSFKIHNADASALRALGVSATSTPGWDRGAQLVLGAAVALLAVRRGRWSAVPLAVVASRLMLDPATYPYYSTGLVLAAAMVDVLRPSRTFPLWTAGAGLFYTVEQVGTAVLSAPTLGLVRLFYCAAVLVALLLPGEQAPVPPSALGSVTFGGPLRRGPARSR